MATHSPKSDDFQDELDQIFLEAQQQGLREIQVKSGDLHRKVGGYPSHTPHAGLLPRHAGEHAPW